MAPIVRGLETKYAGRIKFTYLDAEDPRTESFRRDLGFYYQPEIYLLDANGRLLKKLVGYQSEQDLEAVFAEFLE